MPEDKEIFQRWYPDSTIPKDMKPEMRTEVVMEILPYDDTEEKLFNMHWHTRDRDEIVPGGFKRRKHGLSG